MTTHGARALFVCGSPNQTTQLHRVAAELPEVEAWFSPYYGDFGVDLLRRGGLIEGTIRVGVVNLPWLNRVDAAWLARVVAPFPHVFCLDNHFVTSGQGVLIAATLGSSDAPPPGRLHLIGVEGAPACGANAEVLRHHRLDASSLASRVRQKFRSGPETVGLRLGGRA